MAETARNLSLNCACTERYVAHLEDGTIRMPRKAYQRILVTLTGKSIAELGWYQANTAPVEGLATREASLSIGSVAETHRAVSGLWRADLERREFLKSSAVTAGAMLMAGLDYLVTPDELARSRLGSGAPITETDIRMIQDVSARALDLDNAYGGARFRTALVSFLDDQVTPMFERPCPETLWRDFYTAAAEASFRAGWMAFDVGASGSAQHYYTQALALAKAGGDTAQGADIISHMGYLVREDASKRTEAVKLARTAVHIGRNAQPAMQAHLHALEAWAHAGVGDKTETTASIRAAERAYASISSTDQLRGSAAEVTEEGLAGIFGHCFTVLGMAREGADVVTTALNGFDDLPRSRAFCLIHSANLAVQERDAEKAFAESTRALNLVQNVSSRRVVDELRGFTDNLRTLDIARADDFTERLAELQGCMK